jgi:hypothetical protein
LQPVRLLQFTADEFSILLERDVTLAADTREWAEDDLTGIAPEFNAALDDFELQRANMTFILVFPR